VDVIHGLSTGSRQGQLARSIEVEPRSGEADATGILVAAAWHGARMRGAVTELGPALRLARANQVQGLLARVYPEHLGEELERVLQGNALFGRRLAEAVALLRVDGVEPVLIKCDPLADFVYSNFDLVVGDDGWTTAKAALDGWAVRRSGHRLEPDKVILDPAEGPGAHLHRHASWFGVVAVDAGRLRGGAALDARLDVLRPDPVDELRLLVAHAVFQNLAFDLAELVAIRDLLLQGADPGEAERRCREDGWGHAFAAAFAVARRTMAALDRLDNVELPVALPARISLQHGVVHAAHLARTGRAGMGVRELALRGPLVAAKLRRRLKGAPPVRLIGVSGPDGAGKTTLVNALRDQAMEHQAAVVSLHPYGCVICRRWPVGEGSAGSGPGAARGPLWRRIHQAHAMVDAAELNLRLTGARMWLRLRGLQQPHRPGLVITDRSPIDALAKHAGAGPLVTDWFVGLARSYDRILVLDADDELLARRDLYHSAAELHRLRERFGELARTLDAMRMDSTAPFTNELIGQVLREVTAGRPAAAR
jgi:hypothetical protein